jgi:hypothetical protein
LCSVLAFSDKINMLYVSAFRNATLRAIFKIFRNYPGGKEKSTTETALEVDRSFKRKGALMHIILGVCFGVVVVAPFLGRWRARVWLKKNMSAERTLTHLPRPELHKPNI